MEIEFLTIFKVTVSILSPMVLMNQVVDKHNNIMVPSLQSTYPYLICIH